MNILFVNHHPQDMIGGSEIQCDLLARELTRMGHQVAYLAVNGKQSTYGAPYIVERASLRWGDLRHIVRKHRPDVVYWRFNKRKWLPSALLFRMMGVKVVFAISHLNDVKKWSHKVRFDATDWRGKMRQRIESIRPALSSRVNHLGFCFAYGVIAQLESQTGHIRAPEIVIPNSVDAHAVPFTWPKPFIVWVGSIKQSKHPEQYLQLTRRLQDLPVDCLMIGEIVHRNFQAAIQEAAALPNFHYLGAKTYHEVNGIMRQARLLVSTCEPEGFPNVFIQAWMQGTPTVSAYYDPDQMIQQYQLGAYSGTFEQFEDDVRRLLNDDRLRQEIGQRAKQFAEERFSVEVNATRLERFLMDTCMKR
ncbi:glycosyl transferase group 1 [Candidatus Moduliflexus flocculans]|uniref:Glycosyl transferase group 1 n=1 Tax=Candidatus Moduliflexus flocculans TaxID=1499966 RepID=A0A0S6VUW6_9BACT|nr:glycosyl transferase group 1 [Candidatus Moduliflexus flocculans]